MSNLNPYEDSSPWRVIDIGGLRVPGVVQSIDGHEKPETWDVNKGTEKSGATIVWKGTGLASSIKIVTALHDASSFAAYYALRDALRPKLGTKPPSLLIVNPALNFAGITRVACVNVGSPRWVASGGYWTGEITVIEYAPEKPANTGPAGAAGPASSSSSADEPSGIGGYIATHDPNADVKAEIAKTQAAIGAG